MCRVLDNSLFVRDRKKYTKISECATSFNSLYNKNNIIQDDIFNVLRVHGSNLVHFYIAHLGYLGEVEVAAHVYGVGCYGQ